MTDRSDHRVLQLDLIRFAAIMLVLGDHMLPCPPETNATIHWITKIWARGGWSGVDLFFVLSGFLVSGLIFKEYKRSGNFAAGRFLIRRGFKIYPSFWLLIAATWAYTSFRGLEFSQDGVLGELLFIQNYYDHLWNQTWSLAVEEHFYLFLALLCFLVVRLSKKEPFALIPSLFLCFAIACFAMRFYITLNFQFRFYDYYSPSHLRFDSLFCGVAIAYLWHFKDLANNSRLVNGRKWIFALGVLLFVPFFVFEMPVTPWLLSLGLIGGYLGSGCILLALMQSDVGNGIFVQYAARIGKYSYSIYLWHMAVLRWLVPEASVDPQTNWYLYSAVYLFFSILGGIVLSKTVEYPMLKLRDWLFPAVRGQATSPG